MSCDLGGESPDIVLLDPKNSRYFGMRTVAGRIWGLLEQPIRIEDVVSELISEYDVTEDRCLADTLAFIEELHLKGLVTVEN